MRLIIVHRILIAAGIAFFVFYAGFQLRLFVRGGAAASLAQSVAAAAVAVGFIVYYRTLKKRWGQRP